MTTQSKMTQFLLALSLASLTACGGSSDNVSPGNVVVEVPVEPEPCEGEDCEGGGGPVVPPSGDVVESVIPEGLSDVITASGETAADGREIYNIDVSALTNGSLDPDGLLLGNDVIFRIVGGALRVSNG